MKNPNIVLLCALLYMAAAQQGCKPQNTDLPPQPSAGNLVKTYLNLSAENTPRSLYLAQNQTSDLIAVQVYAITNEVKTAYAKGLFGSMAEIPPLNLIDNQYYAIETSIVLNGQNIIASRERDQAYYRPFTQGTLPQPITADFQYTGAPFTYLNRGDCDVLEDEMRKTYSHPLVARYAGYSGKFRPMDSTAIHIVAKRVYAAFRVRVEDMPSGHVEIAFTDAPLIQISSDFNNEDTTILMSLSGATPPSAAWIGDQYSEQLSCVITQVSTSGIRRELTPIGGQTVTMKRNYIHPLTIQIDRVGQRPIVSIEIGPMIEGDPIVI